jgi:hypothetical protein
MPAPCKHHLPPSPDAQKLSLPGGAVLLDPDVLRLAQPALAPLTPFFQVLDAFLGIVKVVQAIPDAFGPPPNPTGIVSALADLAPKVATLGGLLPQLSLPLTVVSSLDTVVGALQQATARLDAIDALAAKATTASERSQVLGDAQLAQLAACAQEDVQTATANLLRELAPAAGVLGLLGPLLALIGGPTLPSLDTLKGVPLAGLRRALADLVGVLTAIREAIPVP